MIDYAAIEAVNWSTLKQLSISPRHYRAACETPDTSTDAQVIGSAAHVAILEPDSFAARYALWRGKVRRGKKWTAWLDEHPGCESLLPREMIVVEAMASAVRGHPTASAVLSGGRAEETLVWTDPATGIRCKARCDYVRPDGVAELKTAANVEPRAFARAAASNGYHGQLAHYHSGAIELRLIPPDAAPPRIVAVEKSEPYDVVVYELSRAELAAGIRWRDQLLARLKSCLAADYWPGVAPSAIPLELPDWAPGMGLITGGKEELW